jgi:ABC-type oligopeptide transport system substrate-binding subunit
MLIVLSLLLALSLLTTACGGSATTASTQAPAAGETTAAPTGELQDLPALKLIYNTSSGHQLIAETVQAMWKDALGLEVTLENSEWAVFQETRNNGDYQIARHGWLGDYTDPMTFLDMWTSYSGQNDADWVNAEYDALIATAKSSNDPVVRMQAMHDAEKILMTELPVIPVYYYTNVWLDNGKVKNYVHDALLGHMMFTWATKDGTDPIYYHLGATPATLDPQLNNATDGAVTIQHLFVGLTMKDDNNAVVPGVAEKWDVSDDGLTWTFHLRDDAVWTDGKPVTANDFIYAWKRALDPATGSEYAYQVYYVKNAQQINAGEMAVEELGVKAIDDKTLEVTLEAATPYFTQLTAFPTLFPVREDIISKNPETWANDPKTLISNGPYKMTKFEIKNEIVLEKNDSFFGAADLPGEKLVFKLTDDDAAALSAFKTGELDIAESFPAEETTAMKTAGQFNVEPIIGTYFFAVQVQPREGNPEILQNPKFRRALALAIDREYVIEVAENQALPAYAFVPNGMADADNGDFRENGGNYFGSGDYNADIEEARALLTEIGYKVP